METLPRIAIRLGGLALIVYAVINVAQYAPYLVGDNASYKPYDVVAIYLGYVFLPVIFGFVFVRFGGLIAGKLIPPNENAALESTDIETAGVTVLGVFLLYRALSDSALHIGIIYQANQLAGMSRASSNVALVTPDQYGAIVATAVEFAFSLLLVFRAKGLVNLFRAFRNR